VDQPLARIDGYLGIDTGAVVGWFAHYPALQALSVQSYNLLPGFLAAALLLPILFRRTYATRRLILSGTIGLLLTAGIFAFAPAVGPWTVENYTPTVEQALTMLALYSVRQGGPAQTYALIAFPSFHCALAALCALSLWSIRGIRWVGLVVCAAICISTVATGWHYGIDVIGGIAVAILAYATVRPILPAER
jgi:membrane-associated phospholipid phosphatase